MEKKIFLFVICLMFISCSNRNKKSQDLINKYNNKIETGYKNNEKWVESPIMIVTELCHLGEVSKKTEINFRKLNDGEIPTEVEIIISESGLLDDSNSESNTKFKLVLIDDKWLIVE